MTVVYTGGTFDLFHEGHIELLRSCKRIAGEDGKVIVGLNTDEFIGRFKTNLPVQEYRERKLMLESCRYVDAVVKNIGEEDSKITIEEVMLRWKVDIIAIGTDWANRDYYAQMKFTKEWLDAKDLILVYIDRRTGQSTTNLKEQLKK